MVNKKNSIGKKGSGGLQKKVFKEVPLTADDFDEPKDSKASTSRYYSFWLNDLIQREDSEYEGSFENDLILEDGIIEIDKGGGKKKKKEKICPCILIFIISKAPPTAAGPTKVSHLANGNWKRNKKFLNNIEGAITLLKDAGAFDDACIYVYDNLDYSNRRYKDFFIPDNRGRPTNITNVDEADDIIDDIKRSYRPLFSCNCFTLVFSRFHGELGMLIGTPQGFTPIIPDKKRGPTGMKSKNFTFLVDKIGAVAIAHEIGHQAGITHSKDNKLHNKNGKLDANHSPPGKQRDADDLFHPKPKRDVKDIRTRERDINKLKRYIQDSICCKP